MKTAFTVALIIASKGFQSVEYSNTKKALEDAGITVHTVSTKLGEAEGTDGSKVAVDLKLDRLITEEYQGIAFIGGSGAMEKDELDTVASYDIIKKAVEHTIPLGAICIAPRILAKAGVLQGKKVTGWNGDNELPGIVQKINATYIQQDIVTDGTLVTASGPSAATAFGNALVHLIKN